MTTAEKLLRVKTDFDEVYSAGYEKGKAEGGGDSWYDTFWDNYQQNGERKHYFYAFAGEGWTKETFKPKYDIVIDQGDYLFINSRLEVDLVEYLAELGVELIYNNTKTFVQMFSRSLFTRLGELDLSKISMNLYTGFCDNMPNLTRIDKIKANQSFFDVFSEGIFKNSSKLAYIRFEGGLFTNNTVFKTLPLDADTAKHIIGLLTNYAGTANEFTKKITFSPTTWGYLDAEGETASPNGNSWREYINDLGWNAS